MVSSAVGSRAWLEREALLTSAIMLEVARALNGDARLPQAGTMRQSREELVLERFGSAGIAPDKISAVRDTYRFILHGTPSELVHRFRTYYRPTNASEGADEQGRAANLQREFKALFASQNDAAEPGTTSFPATFLAVTVQR